MSDTVEFNVNDIIEEYSVQTNKGLGKYLVTRKVVTKYRGTFFDLLYLDSTNDQKPDIIRGYKMQHQPDRKLRFRKYFDAKE